MKKYIQQVDKVHYETEGYLDLKRWVSYYHQYELVRQIEKLISKKKLDILEIGPGNGMVRDMLRKFGHKVTTMDVAADLNPDILLALPDVPKEKVYDLVLCCEVLEHLNYTDSIESLGNLAKISRYFILSVPDRSLYLSLQLKFPLFSVFSMVFSIPYHRIPFQLGGEHYWEIGTFGISARKFKNEMKGMGLFTIDDFRVAQNPWHHFFLVKSDEK